MSSLAIPSTKSMNRRNSLRLPPQPPPAPVPPSLIKSPYLNAPVFSSNLTSPRLPSEQDERWLQDTVPISTSKSTDAASGASDRRGSVVHPPHRHPQGLGIVTNNISGHSYGTYPRTPGARTPVIEGLSSSSYFGPMSPTTGRSRGMSNSLTLAAHSLAPPPDPYLIPAGTGYAGRPVKLNQAHSTPSVSRLGGASADQAYLTARPSQSTGRVNAS